MQYASKLLTNSGMEGTYVAQSSYNMNKKEKSNSKEIVCILIRNVTSKEIVLSRSKKNRKVTETEHW